MPPFWPGSSRNRIRPLLGLIGLGCGLRLALWLVSLGSYDVVAWRIFASSVSDVGLGETYVRFQGEESPFNHPPTMALLASWIFRLSEATGIEFARLFKLPALAAELVTGLLLYRVWHRRRDVETGLAAAAAYALALSAILISGYHGNTDAVYFCLVFAAAYLMEERRSPLGAGLVMGAALNVKLIPLVCALPLASRLMRVRDIGRYALGGALGAAPFIAAYLSFGTDARRAFLGSVFAYRSFPDNWGVEMWVRLTRALADTVSEVPGYIVRILGGVYGAHGGELVLIASAAFAWWHFTRSRRDGEARFDAYELVALGFVLFLLLTPGFAVQYVGGVVAPLIATGIRRGVVVATVTGAFITALYAFFVVDWSPILSVHGPMPDAFTPLSMAAWLVLLWAGRGLVRSGGGGARGAEPGSSI
jgi:hypothetical protein